MLTYEIMASYPVSPIKIEATIQCKCRYPKSGINIIKSANLRNHIFKLNIKIHTVKEHILACVIQYVHGNFRKLFSIGFFLRKGPIRHGPNILSKLTHR